jgi:hypothetical protein
MKALPFMLVGGSKTRVVIPVRPSDDHRSLRSGPSTRRARTGPVPLSIRDSPFVGIRGRQRSWFANAWTGAPADSVDYSSNRLESSSSRSVVLACVSHRPSTALADLGLSASLRSVDQPRYFGCAQHKLPWLVRLRWPRSQALQPNPSAPPRPSTLLPSPPLRTGRTGHEAR